MARLENSVQLDR